MAPRTSINDMGVNDLFPFIAVIAGGATVILGIILYQFVIGDALASKPQQQRSGAQDQYMRELRERYRRDLWAELKHESRRNGA